MRADARRNYDALLTAAADALAEHGPEAAMEDVARRAGVGIGTLYRHFPTRQALLEAVVGKRLDAQRAMAEELLGSASPGEALTAWLRQLAVGAGTYRGLSAAVTISMLDEGTELYASCKGMREAGEQLLARAQRAGAVRADASFSEIVLLVYGMAWAAEQVPAGRHDLDRLLALVMEGFQA